MPSNIISVIKNNIKKKIPTDRPYFFLACDSKHTYFFFGLNNKFDQNTLSSLISNVFTRLYPLLSIVGLTFKLWPPNAIGFIILSY